MTVFVKLSFFQDVRSNRALIRLLPSFGETSFLLTTIKLFTPISRGSVLALVDNYGQWVLGNEQWAIGHMAYCGQLPLKWGRWSLWVSGEVVEVELIHAPARGVSQDPVFVNQCSVMKARCLREAKYKLLQRKDRGSCKCNLSKLFWATPPFPPSCGVALLLP